MCIGIHTSLLGHAAPERDIVVAEVSTIVESSGRGDPDDAERDFKPARPAPRAEVLRHG